MQTGKTVQARKSHDSRLVRLLSMLVTDTYQWKHGWAAWRIRFHYDNDVPEQTFTRIAALVRDQALPLCEHRAEASEIALYVARVSDLKAVFIAFDHGLPGPGRISAMQSRVAYLEAARLAVDLVDIEPLAPDPSDPPEEEEEDRRGGELPDLRWAVSGFGVGRVAITQAQGHRIIVRMRQINGTDVWSMDVDNVPALAHFRNRADALSKMGVAIALRAFIRQQAARAAARARL